MSEDELKTWVKNSKAIDTEYQFYDSNGNEEKSTIYENAGRFYRIETLNGYFIEKWGERGYIRGEYADPEEVTRKGRIIEEVYYE